MPVIILIGIVIVAWTIVHWSDDNDDDYHDPYRLT